MLEKYISILLFAINFIGFMNMGIDKRRAVRKVWRTPEKWLWLVAILFGAIGTTIGMYVFRHKTKHLSFKFGLPLLALLQVIIVTYYFDL